MRNNVKNANIFCPVKHNMQNERNVIKQSREKAKKPEDKTENILETLFTRLGLHQLSTFKKV